MKQSFLAQQFYLLTLFLGVLTLSSCQAVPKSSEFSGNLKSPVIDSQMTLAEALAGVDENCFPDICKKQTLVTVTYYAFDNKLHQGQLLIDQALVKDIQTIFALALTLRFPIQSVIPIAAPQFRKNKQWDDELSMAVNNTSAFNYRVVAGSTKLSKHSYGRAIDINPLLNPYIKGNLIAPTGASYEPNKIGTLTTQHPLVQKFLQLGWTWGGNWKSLKDYQHFEK